MANRKWLGHAPAVAQVNSVTPTAANNATYTITINGKSISYLSDASATVAEIINGLVAAFNASTVPEFAEITAANFGPDTYVSLTADTAGVPFTSSSSATAGSLVTATVTASAGPNDWSTATNWSGGSVPVSTDDVFIENSSVDILYGLGQSAVTLTSLNIAQTFTGKIGLPERNSNGYAEYRFTDGYLAIGSTTTNIGRGDGTGSGRIKINTGSVAGTFNVYNTGSAAEVGLEPLLIKGTAITAVNVFGGSVGLGVISQLTTETTNVTTLRLYDGYVRTGLACTITTKEQTGGVLDSWFTVTTCTTHGGTHNHYASTMNTVTINGGTLNWLSGNNPTSVEVNSGGVFDMSGDTRAITITSVNLYAGATFLDPQARGTYTNGIDLEKCDLTEVTINLGKHKKITLGAPT